MQQLQQPSVKSVTSYTAIISMHWNSLLLPRSTCDLVWHLCVIIRHIMPWYVVDIVLCRYIHRYYFIFNNEVLQFTIYTVRVHYSQYTYFSSARWKRKKKTSYVKRQAYCYSEVKYYVYNLLGEYFPKWRICFGNYVLCCFIVKSIWAKFDVFFLKSYRSFLYT